MISCYIIGDAITVECLSLYIEKFPLTKLIGYSISITDNLEAQLTDLPKILFVDISFITKFKSALTRVGKLCNIIYLADTKAYAYEAFETFALDYLMKPLTFDLFERSINKFISFSLLAPPKTPNLVLPDHRTETISDSFFIRSDLKGLKEVLIKCSDVVFIEAEQNYVVVHTENKAYVSHNSLKEMEENLSDRFFIRIHKSFIINYDKISSIEGSFVVLNEEHKIQIGLTYKKAFFERKNRKIIKKKNYTNLVAFSKFATSILLIFHFFSDAYGYV